jgi:hypothetical protein
MYVVDFLHEFLLGVWQAVFVHLLRILDVLGSDYVNELDLRCIYTVVRCLLVAQRTFLQIQSHALLWKRYNPTVRHQHV